MAPNPNSQSIVHDGLEKLRRRLLDLSKRNKLLNFRHTNRSSIRVVDELPDELFKRLAGEEVELAFKPVPVPEERERVESKESDLLTMFTVEPEGTTRTRKKVTAKEHAESLGINTSFDLPEGGNEKNPEHYDKYIQTLHYPTELEDILRKISASARTVLEESGTNMLYLIFGFLEWYEDPTSTQPLFAPLVALPVQISKNKPSRASGGMYEFAIQYTGEDLLTNLSLTERMKAFGLSVPELQDEDTPEAYFTRCSGILESQPNWRIRRQITLALLHFGKLLMYQDLDPNRNSGILHHPRVAELLGSQDFVQEISYAETYELDDPVINSEIPPLIFDADSTQHSALIDALQGKNLVIEGPPGTGKSQTITNLIAAALIKGKAVLFVSEKLAALEVVRRRLDQAGLGHFCLELHSHRTKKDKFLKDIQERIVARFPSCEELAEKKEMVERHKKHLVDYVHSIGRKIGKHNKTAFDVMWAHNHYLQKYTFLEPLIESLSFDDANLISASEADDHRLCVDVYSQQLALVIERQGSVERHPWAGVANESLAYIEERRLRDSAAAALTRLESLTPLTKNLTDKFQHMQINTISAIEAVCGIQTLLPQPNGRECVELMRSLANSDHRRDLSDFIDALIRWEASLDERVSKFSEFPPIESIDIVDIKQSILPLCQYDLGRCTSSDLTDLVLQLSRAHDHCVKLNSFFETCLTFLDTDYPVTFVHLPGITKIINIVSETRAGLLELRHNTLKNQEQNTTRARAQGEATRIVRCEEILSQDFVLDHLPSPEALWEFESAISSSSFLTRLFSRQYREAKRHYRAFRKRPDKIKRSIMTLDLKELAEYRTWLRNFSNNREYHKAFGVAFDGLKTPFRDVEELQAWYVRVQAEFAPYLPQGERLLDAIQSQPTEKLKALKVFITENPRIEQDLVALRAELGQLRILAVIDQQWEKKNLGEITSILKNAIDSITRSLNLIRKSKLPTEMKLEDIPGLLDRAIELRRQQLDLDHNHGISALLGPRFQGCQTEKGMLQSSLHLAERIDHPEVPKEIKDWLLTNDCMGRLAWLNLLIQKISEVLSQFVSHWKEFVSCARLDEKKWYRNYQEDGAIASLECMKERLGIAIKNTDSLSEWVEYVRCCRSLRESNRELLIMLGESGVLKPQQLTIAHDFGICNGLTKFIQGSSPNLMNFSRVRHETVRKRFADMDKELLVLQRKQAAHEIGKRQVPTGIGHGAVRNYTELALIRNEISKQRGHISIRSLMNRATDALRALKPCFMMGPMSVAQYLDPRKFQFDVVVMDEASQLKPEEALGAVARGGQLVVVGDPKQLPPTSFFDTLFDDDDNVEEDDSLAIQKSESILDRAAQIYQPIRQLRWHYRSRHESLIAYSNHEFYDRSLILFPSPHKESANLGIKVHLVSEGVYGGSTNRPEAERVVQAILAHMAECPNESLGVATLNSPQRDLIDTLLDQETKKDAVAQAYVNRWNDSPEPFFIKNLETIQGDERDCIFISFTYGPDENRLMYQRFGPINGINGHRRLNVLFTRSRLRTEVFTSMDHEQISIGPDSSWGVKAMKGFLKFAKLGVLEPLHEGRAPEPSMFALAVRDALKERGFDVHCEVGVAGYFVDLAIAHPVRTGSFILGIECDGATYHSSKSARDRDRLREENLANLGWKIHRIWSTDWFRNRGAEIDRLERRAREVMRVSSENIAGEYGSFSPSST